MKQKKYAWHEKTICNYYYEVTNGHIVGEYIKMGLGDSVYAASVNGDSLGQFINETFARKAVEDTVARIDKETELIRKKMPKI